VVSANTIYYVRSFNNQFYFPVGIYLFLATTYSYDSNHFMRASCYLTTSYPSSESATNNITTTDPGGYPFKEYTSGSSNPNAFNFTDIIKITTAGSYYLAIKCSLTTGGTINSGGFMSSFVRIA
jgi:hypothetical protein